MSEYIRTNKFDTNECPNIFVKEKLIRTNVRIYICDQYIRIFEYSNIFVTLWDRQTDIHMQREKTDWWCWDLADLLLDRQLEGRTHWARQIEANLDRMDFVIANFDGCDCDQIDFEFILWELTMRGVIMNNNQTLMRKVIHYGMISIYHNIMMAMMMILMMMMTTSCVVGSSHLVT